jgi:hypothetical protein
MGWPISARQPIGACHDLMEIPENPSGRRSTIVTSSSPWSMASAHWLSSNDPSAPHSKPTFFPSRSPASLNPVRKLVARARAPIRDTEQHAFRHIQ